MNQTKYVNVLALLILLGTPLAANAANIENGKARFAALCATCHGATGKGDGAGATAFPADQKPRNLVEGELKFAKDEEKFKELLTKGGAGVGLSALMPAQPTLSDTDKADLYAFIQSLRSK